MRIEIINTGSELLLGSTLNAHGAWLGQELLGLGLRVQRQVTVPDGDPIRDALRQSIEVSDVVIVTGGLGPTSDDVTREATAEAIGVELIEDEHAVRCIEAHFVKLARPMTPSNLKQAQHPVGADVLPNPHGTAPGVYVPARMGSGEVSPCAIFLLPGPPHEMQPMYHAEVVPRLRALVDVGEDYGVSEVKFSGVGESRFQDELDAVLHAVGDLEVGYCARPGELDLRLIGKLGERLAARDIAVQRYPEFVVSEDGSSLEENVVAELAKRGWNLAAAESCTGGRISNRITDVSGASAVFTHGFITYANEAKVQMLDVREETLAAYGAVSEEVAMEMALGALNNAGADIAVAVTGIAGPAGGSADKPVGTVWLALAIKTEDGVEITAETRLYPQGREVFKQLVSQRALMMVLKSFMC